MLFRSRDCRSLERLVTDDQTDLKEVVEEWGGGGGGDPAETQTRTEM